MCVEAGIPWSALQSYLEGFGRSIQTMQSYNDFSVGGSVSVNVHGRDSHPLVHSIYEVGIVLADGTLIWCSEAKHASLFRGVVGGYGVLGVIVYVKLGICDNTILHLESQDCRASDVSDLWLAHSTNEQLNDLSLCNAVLYPPDLEKAELRFWRPSASQEYLSGIRVPRFSVGTQVAEQLLRSDSPSQTISARS